jgi:hypothetical protein
MIYRKAEAEANRRRNALLDAIVALGGGFSDDELKGAGIWVPK